MRRVAPAIVLFFLSPLVAEFLLGDFGLGALYVLVGVAPMYGAGAVLIREVARRTGRGWPAIVLLALAYGVLEEGFTTMSLFNQNYLGAHVLDQGYVPALGIAIPWTLFVLSLHTIWSISLPIAAVEEWGDRRTSPWLRTPGLTVVSVIFVIGVVLDFLISYSDGHYVAPAPELAGVAVAVVLLVVAAFRMPRRTEPRPVAGRTAPVPALVFAATLLDGGLFMAAEIDALPTWVSVAFLVTALVLAAAGIARWSRSPRWGAGHRLALVSGGLLTYAWHAFLSRPFVGGQGVLSPVSHIVFALVTVGLLYAEARRIRARRSAAAPASVPVSVPVPASNPHEAVAAS
jgi:hypothetical protein